AGVGFREALGRTAVDRLPEHGGIAIAIRLKRHVLTVGGPDREAVVAAEGEPTDRAHIGQLVDRDDRFFTVAGFKRESLAIGRDARIPVRPRRKLQRLRPTLAIEQEQLLLSRRYRTRQIDQGTRI